ncbi:MAG: MBL fold metallo-hydrolase [Bacteroidota bacterium]
MPTLYLLGTGAAVSDPHRTTTMLALATEQTLLAIDCGGDLVQRLMATGLDPRALDGLIVTHEHPDHVAGFPLFMEKIWLLGRTAPLPVYGIAPALAQAQRCLDAFDIGHWGLPDIHWIETPFEPGACLLEQETWRITAAPVQHSVPTVGLRAEHRATGRVLAYSCDTEPCDAVVTLAAGADLLVHEATGEGPGHSSIAQAAEIARRAQAKRAVLVHLPPSALRPDLDEARTLFPALELGEEGAAIPY